MAQLAEQLGKTGGVQTACQVLAAPRSSLYRARQRMASGPRLPSKSVASPRASDLTENQEFRQLLNSPRFQDQALREVDVPSLDEGQYLCCLSEFMSEHQNSVFRL